MRRLVYYVSTSIDGFIADAQGSTRWCPTEPSYVAALAELYPETFPAHLRLHLGITEGPRRFDTVLLGRRTHQQTLDTGLTSAFPHLHQHVFTTRDDLPRDPTVVAHHADAAQVVADLKRCEGRDIWLCGGADLAAQVHREVDELLLRVIPVVLGAGISLMRPLCRPLHFHLLSTRWFDNGVALLHYERFDR